MRRQRYMGVSVFLLWLVVPVCSGADRLEKEPNHLYVCTFNVYKLGSVAETYNSLEDDEEDTLEPGTPERIKNLARILAVGPFDLIVLQEVTSGTRGEWVLTDLVGELKTTCGIDYRYFLSDYIGQGLMPEAIAFIFNPSVVKPEVLSGRTKMAENIPIPGRDLVRTEWEAGDFDFVLVAARLAWDNESGRDAGYNKVEEILTTPAPSAFSHDPDIIILGNFNRFGGDRDSAKELEFDPNIIFAPNVTIFDPAFNRLESVTKASIRGKGIPGEDPQWLSTTVAKNWYVYDVVFFTRDATEEFPPGQGSAVFGRDFGIIHFDEEGGFGFQPGANGLSHNELKEAYSDHRPLWVRFKTNANEEDHTPVGLESAESLTYVGTAKGKCFHLPSCWTIRNRPTPKRWSSRAEAAAERAPCSYCMGKGCSPQ